MIYLILLTTLSMAQEPTYASYSPDPKIKTCDAYITAMNAHMLASQSLAKAGDKPTEKHKELYERINVLQATRAHLEKNGVYDAACEVKAQKAQIQVMPMMTTEERTKASQGLDMLQQVQACAKGCASKHNPADSEMKTCMDACATAVRPQP